MKVPPLAAHAAGEDAEPVRRVGASTHLTRGAPSRLTSASSGKRSPSMVMDRRRTMAKAHGHASARRARRTSGPSARSTAFQTRGTSASQSPSKSRRPGCSMAIAATSRSLTAERASRRRSIRIDTTRRGRQESSRPSGELRTCAHALSSAAPRRFRSGGHFQRSSPTPRPRPRGPETRARRVPRDERAGVQPTTPSPRTTRRPKRPTSPSPRVDECRPREARKPLREMPLRETRRRESTGASDLRRTITTRSSALASPGWTNERIRGSGSFRRVAASTRCSPPSPSREVPFDALR